MLKLSNICQVTHNVGNIRYSTNNEWIGQCGEYKGFVKFIDQIYGIRALLILLRNYIHMHDDFTVRRIISRYAPTFDNNTLEYIKFVEMEVLNYGGNPDYIVFDCISFFALVRAICFYETNYELTQLEYNYVRSRFNL